MKVVLDMTKKLTMARTEFVRPLIIGVLEDGWVYFDEQHRAIPGTSQ